MQRLGTFAFVMLVAIPLCAQRRVDLILDVEGVRRTGKTTFEPNQTRVEPRFSTGGGVGGGVAWFLTDRVSLELKVAALASRLQLRRSGSDFISVSNLGHAQIYPVTALVQWHVNEKGALRPYVGVGVGYVIVRDFKQVKFDNPTGLVVDAGLLVPLSKRWSLTADARYVPIETKTLVHVKPLVVGFGVAYHY